MGQVLEGKDKNHTHKNRAGHVKTYPYFLEKCNSTGVNSVKVGQVFVA